MQCSKDNKNDDDDDYHYQFFFLIVVVIIMLMITIIQNYNDHSDYIDNSGKGDLYIYNHDNDHDDIITLIPLMTIVVSVNHHQFHQFPGRYTGTMPNWMLFGKRRERIDIFGTCSLVFALKRECLMQPTLAGYSPKSSIQFTLQLISRDMEHTVEQESAVYPAKPKKGAQDARTYSVT